MIERQNVKFGIKSQERDSITESIALQSTALIITNFTIHRQIWFRNVESDECRFWNKTHTVGQ